MGIAQVYYAKRSKNMCFSVESVEQGENKCNNCSNCINFNAYYKKTQDRYEKTHFGWCEHKHNHIFKDNICDKFIEKTKENNQLNIKRFLRDFSLILSEYSKILLNEIEERDNSENND